MNRWYLKYTFCIKYLHHIYNPCFWWQFQMLILNDSIWTFLRSNVTMYKLYSKGFKQLIYWKTRLWISSWFWEEWITSLNSKLRLLKMISPSFYSLHGYFLSFNKTTFETKWNLFHFLDIEQISKLGMLCLEIENE